MSAPTLELHHQTPQHLIRLRARAHDPALVNDAFVLAWSEWEHEAELWGVDPYISGEALETLVDGSLVPLPYAEHRALHHEDFVRWGQRGGLATLRRYGRSWFALLGKRRHERITPEELYAAMGSL